MLNSLLRFFGIVKDDSDLENFDPIYGLPKRALDEWLSRNPKLRNEYESKLMAQPNPLTRDGGGRWRFALQKGSR